MSFKSSDFDRNGVATGVLSDCRPADDKKYRKKKKSRRLENRDEGRATRRKAYELKIEAKGERPH